jgi:PhzF family phenazine biosynthesis protein
MRKIAAEFNLSETTFVTRGAEDGLRFRWFTPSVEVDMCGHATIAGVHALAEAERLSDGEVLIETRCGQLSARVEEFPAGGRIIWLALRPPKLQPIALDGPGLMNLLGVSADCVDRELPAAQTQDGDLLFFVRDVMTVNSARPDFARLAEWMRRHRLRGLSLATVRTLAPSIAVQSRFFAPAVGIDEDPVTGSVHGPLTVYLADRGVLPQRDGLAGMMAVQGKAGGRAGVVYGLAEKRDGIWAAKIGGQAVTVMRGTLLL